MTGRVINVDGVEVIDRPIEGNSGAAAESSAGDGYRARPLLQILMFALRVLVVVLRNLIFVALAFGGALETGLRRAQKGLAGFEARFNTERREHDGSQTT